MEFEFSDFSDWQIRDIDFNEGFFSSVGHAFMVWKADTQHQIDNKKESS